MTGCRADGIAADTVQDWFSFLNRGIRKAGVGSTDNHRAEPGDMGFPVTYVRMPTDRPAEAQDADIRSAFLEGRLVVSCGPFVDARIGEAEIGDLAPVGDGRLSLDVRVEAPTWMDVGRLTVVVNGRPARQVDLPDAEGALRFEGTVTASAAAGRDAWVLISVEGDRRHGIWARGRPSFAFTNPIIVDGDGDGAWRMP